MSPLLYKFFSKRQVLKNKVNWAFFYKSPKTKNFNVSSKKGHKLFMGLNRFKLKEYQSLGILPYKKI